MQNSWWIFFFHNLSPKKKTVGFYKLGPRERKPLRGEEEARIGWSALRGWSKCCWWQESSSLAVWHCTSRPTHALHRPLQNYSCSVCDTLGPQYCGQLWHFLLEFYWSSHWSLHCLWSLRLHRTFVLHSLLTFHFISSSPWPAFIILQRALPRLGILWCYAKEVLFFTK